MAEQARGFATSFKVQHTASATAHGRRDSRSIKTCTIADNLGGIAFPHAHLAIRVHRRRKPTGRPETRENVYAVTSLAARQTRPVDLAAATSPRSPAPFATNPNELSPPWASPTTQKRT
ncbi:hypothetical protein ACWC10_24645 [Streptomyces sp. NPDC001595]|uniref:hypothetical protein n=1 Tax=Streptomyces sp. NPDC001532 TaxID=3154520 RepID=UPI00331F501C